MRPPSTIARSYTQLSTGLKMEHLIAEPSRPTATPPVLFVHGTFHGAWCWEARWMARFAEAGIECHAVSLRGTSASPDPDARSVKISQHVDDLRSFVDVAFPSRPPPILVGHSFGGAHCLKYIEGGGPASGVALLCSVPPSGNGPMTARFLRRSLRQAFLITRGFAMKTAARSADDARALFFDERTPDDEIATYLPRLEADSRVGLDLGDFARNLPSKNIAADGRAAWLADYAPRARLVVGCERDAVVDAEGVEETARFMGVDAEIFSGMPHDLMLCEGWEAPADRLIEWATQIR